MFSKFDKIKKLFYNVIRNKPVMGIWLRFIVSRSEYRANDGEMVPTKSL